MDSSNATGVDWSTLTGYDDTVDTNKGGDLLDKEVFLEMLITQLQNQDPLSPMENQEFTDQLASLTQVEQLRYANTNLETLQLYQSSINNAQSVSMIGKHVKAMGDSFEVGDDEANLSFHLDRDASKVEVSIFGPEGNLVQTIEKTSMDEGLNKVSWNGKDINGSPAQEGEYTFTVTAEDSEGGNVEAVTLITGIVQSVLFENGVPMLDIDGQKVSIGDIYEVNNE